MCLSGMLVSSASIHWHTKKKTTVGVMDEDFFFQHKFTSLSYSGAVLIITVSGALPYSVTLSKDFVVCM